MNGTRTDTVASPAVQGAGLMGSSTGRSENASGASSSMTLAAVRGWPPHSTRKRRPATDWDTMESECCPTACITSSGSGMGAAAPGVSTHPASDAPAASASASAWARLSPPAASTRSVARCKTASFARRVPTSPTEGIPTQCSQKCTDSSRSFTARTSVASCARRKRCIRANVAPPGDCTKACSGWTPWPPPRDRVAPMRFDA
mmetsp:Transcript_23380/g.88777  ORF Transcript_23380/g.88777 Transcript_23380/m.88777 type:complete len:203 (-) Transcript_23380:314-922(-)